MSSPPFFLWTSVAIGGTIAFAASAALVNQIIKTPQKARPSPNESSLTEINVIQALKDEHNRIGVERKSTSELLLSMFVYKLCTFSLLVDLAPKLLRLAEMMHLSPPAYWVVRKTFFAQFCGGETAQDCVETMNLLKSAGINSILDLSIESDLDDSHLANQTPEEVRARFSKSAEIIANQISTCINTASNSSKSFAAIKITAMGSPLLLQQVSSTLTALQIIFKTIDEDCDGKVNKDEFRQLVSTLPNSQESLGAIVDQLFKDADRDQDGLVDWVDFGCAVSLNRDESRVLFIAQDPTDRTTSITGLTKEDLEDYKRILFRMEKLCDQAMESHTRLMIDAEQTYFQPAIDSIALHLQERYNRPIHTAGPLIFNTYQMYRRDGISRLRQDCARALRNGYVMAVKLVRGAYMVSERKKAQELHLKDPIWDDIEGTHASYNAGIDFMLEEMTRQQCLSKATDGMNEERLSPSSPSSSSSSLSQQDSPVVLFVASHNKDSVIRTCERMQELGLTPQSNLVMFGQLLGMCDQISYTLGYYGYGIYKYVPYGPIHHVIPYLIRRAQENSTMLGGVAAERGLLLEELKMRFKTQRHGA